MLRLPVLLAVFAAAAPFAPTSAWAQGPGAPPLPESWSDNGRAPSRARTGRGRIYVRVLTTDRRSTLKGALVGGAITSSLAAMIVISTCGHDDGRGSSQCTGDLARGLLIAFPVGAILGAGIASADEGGSSATDSPTWAVARERYPREQKP